MDILIYLIVYPEEILGADNAVWWSANGTYLCYAVFNDTMVPEYKFPIYGDMNSAYGETKKLAYPKVCNYAGNTPLPVLPCFPAVKSNQQVLTQVWWQSFPLSGDTAQPAGMGRLHENCFATKLVTHSYFVANSSRWHMF